MSLFPPAGAIEIGAHRIWVEDDIVVIVVHGTMTGEHALAINKVSRVQMQTRGYILSLVDATDADGLTPEARAIGGQFRREHPTPSANALFGLGIVQRTIALLVYRGLALLHPTPQLTEFFKSDAEGRAWLEAQRPRMRQLAKRQP